MKKRGRTVLKISAKKVKQKVASATPRHTPNREHRDLEDWNRKTVLCDSFLACFVRSLLRSAVVRREKEEEDEARGDN